MLPGLQTEELAGAQGSAFKITPVELGVGRGPQLLISQDPLRTAAASSSRGGMASLRTHD